MSIHVYFSKNNNALNGHLFTPERINGRVMVNPHYPVDLLSGTLAICDGGSFQERDMLNRLQPWSALDRQLRLEQQIAWGMGQPDWHYEGLVTYDMLCGVDEALIDGKRVKRRGTEETAIPAIAETLRSAVYYDTQRQRIRGAIAFAAQGATPDQYLGCVHSLLDLMRPGDWFAFGGFCIIGMQPSLKPLFVETARRTLPLLVKAGIRRAHILGVFVADMVDFATKEARKHGIVISNDSSSAETNSIMGKVFDGSLYQFTGTYGDNKYVTPWTKTYTKEQKYNDYHPCELALKNLQRYHDWSTTL